MAKRIFLVRQEVEFEPQTLNGYLGCGAFGFVFKVKGVGGRSTAVKIIPTENVYEEIWTEGQGEQSHVLREYRMMGQLGRHRNIVETMGMTQKPFSVQDLTEISNLPFLQENWEVQEQLLLFQFRAKRSGSLPVLLLRMELCGESRANASGFMSTKHWSILLNCVSV